MSRRIKYPSQTHKWPVLVHKCLAYFQAIVEKTI